MKVLFISTYPPAMDGVAEYTRTMQSTFEELGISVAILTNTKSGQSTGSVGRFLSWRPKMIRALRDFLESTRPDIIHVQYAVPVFRSHSLLLLILLWKYRRRNAGRVVVTFHEPKRELKYLSVFGKAYYRMLISQSDHINVLTADSVELLTEECKVPEWKISVIRHGLHDFKDARDDSAEIRDVLKINGRPVILFFGFIHIDKGLDVLVEAFGRVLASRPSPKPILVVAGSVRRRTGVFRVFELLDRRYERKVNRSIARRKMEADIVFTGFLPSPQIWSYLRLARIIVLPYTKAEQSGVLNMALSAERAIIASDLRGFRDLLGEPGLLVKPGDPELLSRGIQGLLNDDEATNDLVASYGRKKLDWSFVEVCRAQLKRYQELL
jgi:glycosyltransferase involved in cell wall biosynthesis